MKNLLSQVPINSKNIDPAPTNYKDIIGILVSRLLIYSIAAAGMYFLVRTVIAGFTFLTSLGDPGKVQAAQQTLSHSIIGLIIVINAFFLAQIVQTVFGVNLLGTP